MLNKKVFDRKRAVKTSLPVKGLLCFLALIAAWFFLPLPGLALSETPYDLVDTVNALRASYGLVPYQIDANLMTYAQEHAEYQAAIQHSTHEHGDGTGPWDYGYAENVAGGTDEYVTVAIVVYEIWADWGHRHTMIGYVTGDIGAGMALSADGNVYYTIDVRPGAPVATTEPGGNPTPGVDSTPGLVSTSPGYIPTFVPLLTNTPDANSAIIHVVSSGETLWSIAVSYGVKIDAIRLLNGIPEGDTFLYVGQRLLIRPAGTPGPVSSEGTPTVQATGLEPPAGLSTSTPTPVPSQPAAPHLTASPLSPSATLISPPVLTADAPVEGWDAAQKNASMVVLAVLILAILGVLGGILFGFGKSQPPR